MAFPLVLVHGHPFDHTMWNPQLEAFSATRRVIAPDLRGYGASPLSPGISEPGEIRCGSTPPHRGAGLYPYAASPRGATSHDGAADDRRPIAPPAERLRFEQFAQDIAALLDELEVQTCVLAGLSMGGQVAMDFYRQFPHRVRGLVLADTFPAPETPEGVEVRHAMADRLLREGMRPYADEVLEKMVAPYASAEVKAHVHRMMTATRPESAAAALRARAARPDYRELLRTVTVPALVVVGADDTYTPVSDAEAMHAALPDSTLHVIEGTAHMPNLERPKEFNGAMGSFLARIDSAGG